LSSIVDVISYNPYDAFFWLEISRDLPESPEISRDLPESPEISGDL
jgi:hypothetical protein